MNNLHRIPALMLLIVSAALAKDPYPIEQGTDSPVAFTVTDVRKQPPAFVGEANVRVLLRLQNRKKQGIFVEAFDLSSQKGDSALLHDVFEKDACPSNLAGNNIPPESSLGYSRLHTFSVVQILPRDPITFSVPVDHLQDGRCVRVRYWFGEGVPPKDAAAYRYAFFRAKGLWVSRVMRGSGLRQPQQGEHK